MTKAKPSSGAGFKAMTWPDRIAPLAGLLGGVLCIAGFLWAFLIAGPANGASVDGVESIGGVLVSNKLLLSQKIFFFHMPVAITSMVMLLFAGWYSIRFLMTKRPEYDTRAKIIIEVGLVLVLCTMVTGDLWTRFEWGVWWTWEPRLTTYLILMLLCIAYFILRNAIDEPERRATYSAVFGVLICADVPICYMITRLIPSSLHPVVTREGGIAPDMLPALLLCMFGFLLVGFALYRLRLRAELMEQKLADIQEKLED